MTDINFKCAKCGEIIKAADRDVGKQGSCPACGGTVIIPGGDSPGAPAALSQPLVVPSSPGAAPRAVRTLRKEISGFAIAGLVCGILSLPGFLCGGFILAIIGVVFSVVARNRIRREPDRFEGDGLAVAGLIVSIVGLAIGLVVLLFVGSMMLATGSIMAGFFKMFSALPMR